MTRRGFMLQSGAAMAAAAATKPSIGDIKPSLYSVTYIGLWYRGEALTMEQLLDRARRFGYEGVEIEAKRPHGFALDWPKSRCTDYRKRAKDMGLAITGVAAMNDFSSSIPEQREAELANVRDLIRMTGHLDAKVLRVFLAWPGAHRTADGGGHYDLAQRIWQYAHEGIPEAQLWAWCRDTLAEAAKIAGDHGVTLALQNHKPIIKTYHDVLRMVRDVGSPHLKVCLDAPIMENKEADYLRKAVRDAGALQVQSHFGGEYERKQPGGEWLRPIVRSDWGKPYERPGYWKDNFYLPFIETLLETGYKGYIGYELCHTLPVVDGKTVGIDFVDRNAQLALEFIRETIAQARRRVAQA
ncbi:MAG: sugar phosphate isomerase/epimerase family protein [Bryobacteraceae bacterium]